MRRRKCGLRRSALQLRDRRIGLPLGGQHLAQVVIARACSGCSLITVRYAVAAWSGAGVGVSLPRSLYASAKSGTRRSTA
jgi:hypothetical protein